MANDRRKSRIIIDREVQGALIQRAISYWLVTLVSVLLMLMSYKVLSEGRTDLTNVYAETWKTFGPAIVASMLVLPVIIWDVVKMSYRFVGPMYQLRQGLKVIASGEEPRRMKFRDDDYWQSAADEFNAVASTISFFQKQTDEADSLRQLLSDTESELVAAENQEQSS